ncbi:peptidylprolyl isomerase [Gaopeijia maritima]|uniref:peptidylprolyl isomerase n=1 Tax=Gaopeijia maritima TaxID=3119007 RepID=UPI00325497E8
MVRRLLPVLCAPLVLLAGCGEAAPPAASPLPGDAPPLTAADLVGDSVGYLAVLAAEDRRAPTRADMATLLDALESESNGTARAAARALGRLERPELAEPLLEVLGDPAADASTRAEAANAVAQSVRAADPDTRRETIADLLSGASPESPPELFAALARSVARIPPADDAQATEVAGALVSWAGAADHDVTGRLGLARAILHHRRITQRAYPEYDAAPLLPLLEELATDADAVVRGVAVGARRTVNQPPSDVDEQRLLDDPAPTVRREAMMWAGARQGDSAQPWQLDWLRAGLNDEAAEVRIAAVQGWIGRARETEGCQPLIAAATNETGLSDPGDAVALAAIGGLTPACAEAGEAADALRAIVSELPGAPTAWHRPAAALIALTAHDPEAASAALPAFVEHDNPFARTAAATAAGRLEDDDLLRRLTSDPDANVRDAALRAWGERAPTELVLAQLERPEPQLLQAASALLESRSEPAIAPALLDALDRASSPVRATMRDARVALLETLGEVGSPESHTRLEPYLSDDDPAVAALAASIVSDWSGVDTSAQPTGLPSLPLPSFAELAALEDSVAVVTMAGGDRFVIATLPFEAPTNAVRFMRMARAGEFDGLTWHRVVPNFVVQGGSPYANEYAGHGDYTRDEIGLVGHFAGTLGVSTRGRDTADGQVFINLVDNLRLDHDYTVFGYLVEGLDAVQRVRAGDVIERIEVRGR